MGGTPPRRRDNDKDRRRWPDERLDDLKEAQDDLDDEMAVYRRLPDRVSALRDQVSGAREALEVESQRVTDIRADLRDVSQRVSRMGERLALMDRKLDKHIKYEEEQHERQEQLARGTDPDTDEALPVVPTFRPDWRFWLKLAGACAIGGGVPIATALIAASAVG